MCSTACDRAVPVRAQPEFTAGTAYPALRSIEKVSLNLDLNSNCHWRSKLGGTIMSVRCACLRAEFLENHARFDGLAEADVVTLQEAVRGSWSPYDGRPLSGAA
jgi:hypothetical protein